MSDSMTVLAAMLGVNIAIMARIILSTILILFILYCVGLWKIFTKMKIAGWKAFIPIYNLYLHCGKVWNKAGFILLIVLPIINNLDIAYVSSIVGVASAAFYIIFINKTMKSFGRGIGSTILYFFFPNIMVLVVGLGRDEYIGNTTVPGAFI